MSYFCKLKSKSHRDRQAEWAVQEIERLRAENAELRNDAERYRWLRDENKTGNSAGAAVKSGMLWNLKEQNLDAAIDEKMKGRRDAGDVGSDTFGLLIVPHGEPINSCGCMAENRAELLAEDIECLHMALDKACVPRIDGDDGPVFSMWGRVLRFKEMPSNAENDELREHAAMYLWLRDKSLSLSQVGTLSPYCVLGQSMKVIDGIKLDVEIRAAMKEKA